MLDAEDISVQFGGVRAVDGVSLQVGAGDLVGVVGPNGSGKTSLLNALSGVVPATGRLRVEGRAVRLHRPSRSYRAGLLRVFQAPQCFESLTVLEDVAVAVRDRHAASLTAAITRRPAMWRHERARWDRAAAALERVGLGTVAAEETTALAYGQQRRVELARALAAEPKLLLLDEPSAGLNDAETASLATLLAGLRTDGLTILVVDHKIDFVDRLCNKVAVLELGRKIAEGTPAEVWADAHVMDAYLGVADDAAS